MPELSPIPPSRELLHESEWLPRRATHMHDVDLCLRPHLERARRGEKHPVMDFLFTYYAFRPSWLRRWHPGIRVGLIGSAAEKFLEWTHYVRTDGVVSVKTSGVQPQRIASTRWMQNMLKLTAERAPSFGCHGLHEWAMVYGRDSHEIRHTGVPLRLPARDIDEIVRARRICCTHFDAYRHFASAAQPLNRLHLTREISQFHEQPGCLHANMDLYKWASKLTPFSPSELVLDTFRLAVAIREVDMRASPYDLASLGYAPIRIETEEGRLDYERHQRLFHDNARPLRERLIKVCDALIVDASEELTG